MRVCKENSQQQEDDPCPLSDFRDNHAWVLLGEPGAGKTIAFEEEAKRAGCKYLHMDDFLDLSPEDTWKTHTLFLDGLDEVRARDGHGALGKVRQRLSELGTPRFRIACRSVDWYEATDRKALTQLSPGGLEVLTLEPLKPDEICQILRENHGIQDAESFIENLKAFGLQDLLGNPLTLELFAKGRSEGKAPRSKEDAYRLGCETLCQEENSKHQAAHRNEPCPVERMMDAAGQLSAVILLADLHGVALTEIAKDKRFASLAEFDAKDVLAARRVLDSRLFRSQGPDRIIPIHRSVAEYLGARWMAKQVDESKMPSCRILRSLTGYDGRPIGSLRGLFGWLATLSGRSRTQMIQADPVAILAYGDVKKMMPSDKRAILAALRKEADFNPVFDWDYRIDPIFAPLSDKALSADLRSILEDTDRCQAHQIHARCVLCALENGESLPELLPALWAYAEDTSHWAYNRKLALRIGLKWESDPTRALNVLQKIQDGAWDDPDDNFLAALLDGLYPDHLGVEKLLDHIHSPKNTNLIGSYDWYLRYELPKKIPADQVAICLDELAKRSGQAPWISENRLFVDFATAVLLRGLQEHGDSIEGGRLLRWFSVWNFGQISYTPNDSYRKALEWLGLNPGPYKKLLTAVFDFCRSQSDPVQAYREWIWRLDAAPPPSGIGSWHLIQAGVEPKEELARLHLELAFDALCLNRGAEGLSLDLFFDWARGNSQREGLLQPFLSSEVSEWRWERAKKREAGIAKAQKKCKEEYAKVKDELPRIRMGTAPSELMKYLACLWLGLEVPGKTPEERFQNHFYPWEDVFSASETGFLHCPERSDLPNAEEILEVWRNNKEYHLQFPCLIAMEMRWIQDGKKSLELKPEILKSMITFQLVSLENPHDWFKALCEADPEIVSEILIPYICANWEHGEYSIPCLYWLDGSEACFKQVAELALPTLLLKISMTDNEGCNRHLESLLKFAFQQVPTQLGPLCEQRLKQYTRGVNDRLWIPWLTANLALVKNPDLSSFLNISGVTQELSLIAGKWVSWLSEKGYPTGPFRLSLLSGMAERLAKHASAEDHWDPDKTEADECRDLVHAFIRQLGEMEVGEGLAELERLILLPTMGTFEFHLKQTLAQQREKLREAGYQKMDTSKIVRVLSGGEPASREDLLRLVLDHLEDIAKEIKKENDDGYRAFWNVSNHQPCGKREENLCRDQLLTRLRYRLLPLGVACAPEYDNSDDKRADLWVSYRNEFAIPIEIKRDDNRELWTALHDQLIPQYTQNKMAQGFGIYLVLWFGNGGMKADPSDKKKAVSIEDLQKRLEAQIPLHDKKRVVVRVMDVSWPPKEKLSKPAKTRSSQKSQPTKATTKKNPKARRGST